MVPCSSIIVGLFVIPGCITVLDSIEFQHAVPCNKACVHGGQCVITPDPTCSGSGYKQTCNCPPSYTGEFCENFLIKVECDKLCQNGGRCVVNFKDDACTTSLKTCVCPDNYYGDLCDTFSTVPICDPPCTAGQGECVVLRNSQLAPHLTDGAYCNCSTSATGYYYGSQCQHYQQKGTCDPTCRNGGECNYKGTCICRQDPKSYSNDCSEFDPVCYPACQNGGTCYRGSCQCTSTDLGYYNGSACEQFQDNICNPACQNGGTCYRGSCTCKHTNQGYYYGSACEQFQDNICNPTCQNGGICYRGYCQCESTDLRHYYGISCEQFKQCVGSCLNGGTCDTGGKCRCLKEYTGVNCETYTGCPCQNNGQCIDDRCRCAINETGIFSGDLCGNFNFYYPCFPSVLNGGYCLLGNIILCPYDDIGYFHGDQCEKYSPNNCSSSCIEPEVCVADRCNCPYNLTERSFTVSFDRCKRKYYY